MNKKKVEKILALMAIMTVIIAGILGIRKEAGQVENNVGSIVPNNYYAEAEGDMRFSVYQENTNLKSYYIIIEPSNGYGGEMDMAILVDTMGSIIDLKVIKHRETPSYLEKVKKKGLIKSLRGKSYSDPLMGKEDISVVSGATYTSEAIINSARTGSRKIASEALGYNVPDEVAPKLKIAVPEIVLVLLYIIAFISIYTGIKIRKQLRWLTMLTGLVILGFWFAVPLSLAKINAFLLGFWPDWHLNLYWYLLVFGFVFTILVSRKNIYCNWICPLGCIQDILGLVGDAKPRFSRKTNRVIIWISRLVAWLAIVLALYYRNPVKLNYEIFGVAVNLTGASYLFAITGVFFIASVFISRPWCNYLCPATPLYDFIKILNPVKKEKTGKNNN